MSRGVFKFNVLNSSGEVVFTGTYSEISKKYNYKRGYVQYHERMGLPLSNGLTVVYVGYMANIYQIIKDGEVIAEGTVPKLSKEIGYTPEVLYRKA